MSKLRKNLICAAKRIVLKVGTSLLTRDDQSLNLEFISHLGEQIAKLRENGLEIVIITSGAVAAGHNLMGWSGAPKTIPEYHVRAAVGQVPLYSAYSKIFGKLGITLAQILLTEEELSHRSTYINARVTLRSLLDMGVLPVINENDATAISERRFGDNDRLAAEIANLIEADMLVIFTDVDGIYTDMKTKEVLPEARANDRLLGSYIDSSSALKYGSGGMASKLEAALRAGNGGTGTVIMNGAGKDPLAKLLKGEQLGTLLWPPESRMSAKERWLATCAKANGKIYLDRGAITAIMEKGRSILPIGVVNVEGNFRRGDVITCVNENGQPVAQGMSNYDGREVSRLLKKHSSEIESILGYKYADEIIHRDNMVNLV